MSGSFAASLSQANIASKKMQMLQQQHVHAEKKITDLTNKFAQKKEYDFMLGRMSFTDNNGYQNFLVFVLMLSSLVSDSKKNSY